MPNRTPTAALAGTFARNKNNGVSAKPITSGKLESTYGPGFGSSSKRTATANQKIRSSGPSTYREFDKPENRGKSLGNGKAPGTQVAQR